MPSNNSSSPFYSSPIQRIENNPTQPLSSDVVDKLLNNKDLRGALFAFFNNSEEVTITKPIYDTRKRMKLDANGLPIIDPETKSPVMEEIQVKVGEETHKATKKIYLDDKTKPLVNLECTREITGMIEIDCNSTTRASYVKDRDMVEVAKDIAQKITNQIIIRYKDYEFALSPSRAMNLFQNLTIIIASYLTTSDNGAMLRVVQNTHQFNSDLGNAEKNKFDGIINAFKKAV